MSDKVEIKKVGNNLVITVPMHEPTISSTGKTKLVASAQVKTDIVIEGKQLVVGVNAYIKA